MKTLGVVEFKKKRHVVQEYHGAIYVDAFLLETYPKDLQAAVRNFINSL